MNPASYARNPARIAAICLLILFSMGVNSGCMTSRSPDPVPVRHSAGNRIAFLPVKNMSRLHGVRKSVISPISGKVFMTGEVMENAEGIMAECVMAGLKNRRDIAVVSIKQAKDVMAAILTDDTNTVAEKNKFKKMGRVMKADAVLVGYLYRFRQRVGNRHSVSMPASVVFELYLMDVSDESVIWGGSYNETQQSLSENLFEFKTFIKRKGRWITARELAVAGLEEMLKDFPEK